MLSCQRHTSVRLGSIMPYSNSRVGHELCCGPMASWEPNDNGNKEHSVDLKMWLTHFLLHLNEPTTVGGSYCQIWTVCACVCHTGPVLLLCGLTLMLSGGRWSSTWEVGCLWYGMCGQALIMNQTSTNQNLFILQINLRVVYLSHLVQNCLFIILMLISRFCTNCCKLFSSVID